MILYDQQWLVHVLRMQKEGAQCTHRSLINSKN